MEAKTPSLKCLGTSELRKFITQNQNEYRSFLLPGEHIASGMDYDLPYAISYLQNRVRSALFFFINGSYWLENNFERGLVTNIYSGPADPHAKNILKGLLPALCHINKKFSIFGEVLDELITKSLVLTSNQKMARIFCAFYKEFDTISYKLHAVSEAGRKSQCVLDEKDYKIEDKKYLKPLFDLQKFSNRYFKDMLEGFYLHGSLASMDYIRNWSDLDTFMVIKKETLLEPNQLNELRKRSIQSHKFLYRIDPYQLHGHLLISEFDLNYYPQIYFPSVLLNYSKSFFYKEPILTFCQRDCHAERLAAFWFDAIHYFVVKTLQYKNKKRPLRWNREKKLFIHRLLTFPLFYLQAKGHQIYKKYSFDKAEKDFDVKIWQVIREATSFMDQWKKDCQTDDGSRIGNILNSKLYFLFINANKDFRTSHMRRRFKTFEKNYEWWLYSALNLSFSGWRKTLRTMEI